MNDYIFTPVKERMDTLHEDLQEAGTAFLNQTETTTFFVDLSGLHTLNSRSLGALVSLTNKCIKRGRSLVLRNLTPKVEEILTLTNLIRVLRVEKSSGGEFKHSVQSGSILQLDYTTYQGIGVFKFSGTIENSRDSAMFLNIVNKIIHDGQKMLIDMGDIEYIDSLGIGVLVRLFKLIQEGRALVRFFGANAMVRQLLEVNRLTTIIKLYNSRDEALLGWINSAN
ncbi:MAG: hypothetical protein A2268_01585 [Candidatus Raymondbacteria bacterium RifOxyA12_full_50_37]|uniref:STAS domain-containing protein n=1 Tax=Candidatus Raymondbacteria bacterium RIFOXYD12_FULL_49_13 TaxID=1817890 RepID=A0A1F7FA65_UNCRA|nr:MAG: hypothetical protein A2268_01585 [Candidatus Raymondbacteria bacterium RifOxyA12_full_50_37]OGJ87757.1 MAG: hypothetical protein A2248_07190 [Candidatus Raymondbacteria bacterium RIFOXYA2_FULL_49_16]OGJ94748.1 MAG: hypothetical protein A2350_12355 [Candidatus Raymondbacteria bacterium RifOxyB12_full_50_8]OGJ95635.1 MAG: hypothetical protein A2453_13185 [Candidatus Raymondbacteria bacterium RIFOXYC2_FULL_50_21]OGK03407.1 MAG: hypothetical protein A2519_15460 [Candidatus Raymondbacteria b